MTTLRRKIQNSSWAALGYRKLYKNSKGLKDISSKMFLVGNGQNSSLKNKVIPSQPSFMKPDSSKIYRDTQGFPSCFGTFVSY